MDVIETILELAAQLPSGLNDPRAAQKLYDEQHELEAALRDGDDIGALTEVADVVYYAVKAIQYAANLCGITTEQAMDAAVAKYRFRARPGNPKDDAVERAAVRQALGSDALLFLSLCVTAASGDGQHLIEQALREKKTLAMLTPWEIGVLRQLAAMKEGKENER